MEDVSEMIKQKKIVRNIYLYNVVKSINEKIIQIRYAKNNKIILCIQ